MVLHPVGALHLGREPIELTGGGGQAQVQNGVSRRGTTFENLFSGCHEGPQPFGSERKLNLNLDPGAAHCAFPAPWGIWMELYAFVQCISFHIGAQYLILVQNTLIPAPVP